MPNATVMIVEHPERFGLSQLHQLRGRGGAAARSRSASWSAGRARLAARLQVLMDTDDGFEIARADLRLRGMGDLFGERQSGLPMFRVADPIRDEELNVQAREAASAVMERDPELKTAEYKALRKTLSQRYARAMELFRVG